MKTMRFNILCAFVVLSLNVFAQGGVEVNQMPFENDYAFGLDLSFVKSAEKKGQRYYDTDGTEKSPFDIFRTHGYNWARLMICTEPSYLGQNIDYVVEGAKELKRLNYHFALDYMLCDGWSNPMTQPMPSTWKDFTPAQIEKACYEHVYSTMKRLKDEGLMPEIVQIGNEISNGAFWPTGRVFYGKEKIGESHWKEFTDYIKAGIKAVRDIDTEKKVRIMLHADFGGDVNFSNTFFTKLKEYNVEFDIAGFSFYPWSHGTLMDLRDNLAFVSMKFGKPVMVIETGYYSVPSQYFEKAGIKSAFPETPEGQKNWFQAVNNIVMSVPNNMGLGVFWWEPMFRGRGFFDDETNKVKPIVDAFEQYTMPSVRADGNTRIWDN